ncbi:hypothetical protein GH984_07320 [Spiribacter sp. C176]|uniref:Capsule synthesis protein CapA domain-containing protein n=1 Tax=Spiribacter salilacus TaxID=2664894 RepID=A0A6N7R0L0_9GAMM|nr:CapA family protein [Spiribacter salilacus]MRH78514.1 hypothetical protein [Spiribacter salilacus]
MIFIGDVAIAPGDRFRHVGFPDNFQVKPICLNLEGAISPQDELPARGLCNSVNSLDSFKNFTLGPVFLGNNHITDIPDGISITQTHLAEKKLQFCGAGCSQIDAESIVIEGDFVCLGFGWPVIQCLPASSEQPGVNRFEGNAVRKQVNKALKQHPQKKLIAVFHWNYEFEPYPQPGHRALAMELIDMGVHAIIGHHPHVVGPVECYRGHTIAYSLGNWAFSYGRFLDGQLRFPEKSFEQIALEISPAGNIVHKVRFELPDTIRYCFAEEVDAPGFSLKPEFEGMSSTEYLTWFKANRVKRKALPIYRSADSSLKNLFFDNWVAFRQFLIRLSTKLGLKSKSPNG